jgi:gliding motility-associated-like protein
MRRYIPYHTIIFTGLMLFLMGYARPVSGHALKGPLSKPSLDVEPPVFTDPPAEDTLFLSCLDGFIFNQKLEATDDNDPTFPKLITPVFDKDTSSLDLCAGDTLTRSWIAMDAVDMLSTRIDQVIVVKDTLAPAINIAEIDDTIPARSRLNPEYRFDTWASTFKLQLVINTMDNCGSIEDPTATMTPAATFLGSCETRSVTYVVEDQCGNSINWTAQLTTLDTIAPSVIGVNDTVIELTCLDDIPPTPVNVFGVDTTYIRENHPTLPDTVVIDTLSITFKEKREKDLSCPFEEEIIRVWLAQDACGNQDSIQQQFIIKKQPPEIILPFQDTLLACADELASLPQPQIIDICDPEPTITITEVVSDSSCVNDYTITRTITATDGCNRTSMAVQTIVIRDTVAPTFEVPRDTVIADRDALIALQQEDIFNIVENCSGAVDTVLNAITEIGEPCDRTLIRSWALEDVCGNRSDTLTQTIIVRDTIPPSFVDTARDTIIYCEGEAEIDSLFGRWASSFGGARAEDNFSRNENLVWSVRETMSGDTLTVLPPQQCDPSDSSQIYRQLRVDFIVTDECNNVDTTSATFTVLDTIAPQIVLCPTDTLMIPTDSMDCLASYILYPPVIEENCFLGSNMITLVDSAFLSFDTTQGVAGDVAVDPVQLDLEIPLPLNIQEGGTLSIALKGIDGEQLTEFFSIYGEDSTFLGRTNNTPAQCDTSMTDIELSVDQIRRWGQDGVLSILLDPNVPEAGGRDAINAICDPRGVVSATLTMDARTAGGLSVEYRLNEGPTVMMGSSLADTLSLEQGLNQISYFVYDCVGNVDSCSYWVSVVDNIAPIIDCPADITLEAAQDTCSASLLLPLPLGARDNCSVIGQFEATLPSDTSEAYFTFTKDANLDDFIADNKTFIFENVSANAIGQVDLTFQFKGNFNDVGAFVRIFDENGSFLGRTSLGDANCGTEGTLMLNFSADAFNTWAEDGIVRFEVEVNDITVPPGIKGDGINPCNPAIVLEDGDTDSLSYMFATLRYGQLKPDFYTQGATVIPTTSMEMPTMVPRYDFNVGETEVFYTLEDVNGNIGECSFTVTVEDNQAPVALCQPTTLFINPSGLDMQTVNAEGVDAGSFDNCGITELILTPNTFDCQASGDTPMVTLLVRDSSGNEASCSTIVRVETLKPAPTANSGLCGSDTLFLFSNPPPAMGGIVFSYEWTGPNGFTSNLENPIIPNVDSDNAGSYTVRITGITGCSSIGVVEVAIEDLPLTPEINGTNDLCVTDDIVLQSSLTPSGTLVNYRWYRGQLGSGELIATTDSPILTIPGPHDAGISDYYLELEVDGCISKASPPLSVRTSQVPLPLAEQTLITVCEGEDIRLASQAFGEGISYLWNGPNGFESNVRDPLIPDAGPEVQGSYSLVVFRNGCPSPRENIEVVVLNSPDKPEFSTNSPVCVGEELRLRPNNENPSFSYIFIAPDGSEFRGTPELEFEEAQTRYSGNWRLIVSRSGCVSESSDPVVVSVNNIPEAQISVSSEVVCEGTSLNLFGAPDLVNATYRWTGPNGYSSGVQNPVIASIGLEREGTFELRVTSEAGCSDTASVDINVVDSPRITAISNNGPDCIDGPTDIELVASVFPLDGDYEYLWTGPNDFQSMDPVAVIPRATEADNGSYRLVVTNENGCPSAARITQVNVSDPPAPPSTPMLSSFTPLPLCLGERFTLETNPFAGGEVSYNWDTPNGIIITQVPSLTINSAREIDEGEYSVFVTVDGCDSRISGVVQLSLNNPPQAEISSNSPVCEGNTISLISSSVPGATYSWSGPGFTSTEPNPIIANADSSIHSGTYSLVVTRDGCSSEAAVTVVNVISGPAVPILTGDNAVCIDEEGGLLTLEVDSAGSTRGATYEWEDPFGRIVETPGRIFNLSDFEEYSNQAYEFRVRSKLGTCVSDFSLPKTIQFSSIPAIQAFAGEDRSVCQGEVVRLMAEPPSVGTGTWSVDGTSPEGLIFTDPNSPNSAVSGLMGGQTYTLRWTLSNGACMNYDFDAVQIEVAVGEVAMAGDDQRLCGENITTLSATQSEGINGRWTQPEVQRRLGVEIVDPLDPSTQVRGMQPGNVYEFTWNIQSGCGTTSDKLFVNVSDPFSFAGFDQVVCNDDGTGQLMAEMSSEGSIGRWRLVDSTSGVQVLDPFDPMSNVRNLQEGENLFIWELDEGFCGDQSRDTVILEYIQNPDAVDDNAATGFDQPIEINVLLNDTVGPNPEISIITPPANGTIEEVSTGIYLYRPSGNFVGVDEFVYELCSGSCDCSRATVRIQVGDDAECIAPNVITPNNDGINDTFVIPCLLGGNSFPNSQVFIFNQWGDEVYRSSIPYQNNWRGTFNGEDLPAGTYFYIVEFGGLIDPLKGYLYIYR